MGLCVTAKGLSPEESYDCGYISFNNFRVKLAKAYNEEFGELYRKYVFSWSLDQITQDELERLNELSNSDLNIFLEHSDCDGKMTPTECKKVFDVIKDIEMDLMGHNYGDMETYNVLEQWKLMFHYCHKYRVNLYFS